MLIWIICGPWQDTTDFAIFPELGDGITEKYRNNGCLRLYWLAYRWWLSSMKWYNSDDMNFHFYSRHLQILMKTPWQFWMSPCLCDGAETFRSLQGWHRSKKKKVLLRWILGLSDLLQNVNIFIFLKAPHLSHLLDSQWPWLPIPNAVSSQNIPFVFFTWTTEHHQSEVTWFCKHFYFPAFCLPHALSACSVCGCPLPIL